MKTSDLLLSNLSITEDDYSYNGSFFLSNEAISVKFDMNDLQSLNKIEELKRLFLLEESCEQIRKSLMDMVVESACISSKINEGENYEEKALRFMRRNVIRPGQA